MPQIANSWAGVLDPLLAAYAVNAFVVVGYLHYVVRQALLWWACFGGPALAALLRRPCSGV